MSSRPHAHRGRPPLARGAVALLSALLVVPAALAGPTGGQVVAGSGSIQRPDASTTLIQQQSHSLAVDWAGFDVASHELVQFQQPSSSSAALNRVFNELPSQIHGRIEANGRIFIMNPSGVVFGPEARVEVGGLMASSLNVEVEDFMSGHLQLTAPQGGEPGAVVNRGLIKAATGGSVALLGGTVRNDGVIIADLGHVLMGAGREALVDFDGDGLIRFHVDGALLQDIAGDGSAVSNSGEIHADGGQVLLSAVVARDIVDSAVNNEGIIRAASIDRSAGTVRLSATGGAVESSGTIDVSATQPGSAGSVVLDSDTAVRQRGQIQADAVEGDGGRVTLTSAGLALLDTGSSVSARAALGRGGEVRVLGDSVAMLDAAVIDVSGGNGGGTVLVGGDYRGANPDVANARLTGVAGDARIRADATGAGNGGHVIVWSDDTTNFLGHISARGGPDGGDGGFAEVSGKEHLSFRGSVDLTAAQGNRGTLLLDPSTLVITGGSDDGDADGSDAQFEGNGPSSAAGQILFSDAGPSVVYQSEIEAQSAFSDITLQATRSISTAGNFDNGGLALAPDSNLLIETRNNGSGETGLINLIGSAQGTGLNIETSGSGTITVRSGAGGDRSTPILLPNLISASDIHVSAGGGPSSSVLVFGKIQGANVDVDATGSVTVVSGARVVAGGDGTSLTIDATGITLLDGAANAATIANSGTGSVALNSAGPANIVLGEHAISTGVGMLSLSSGRSIIAVNLTDVGDTVNEIVSAGAVSLTASDNIGTDSEHIEIAGVTDLIVDIGEGDLFVSGSNAVGGAGRGLSSLTLTLEPDDDAAYVIENFSGQVFDFAQGTYGDELVIREITSASVLDLVITTDERGIRIGGTGGAGIRLAGAGNVTLDSHTGIGEAVFDDAAQVVAEITTDGRVTLVARNDVGGNGMLDLAAGAAGVSTLEAASELGAVRINGLDALRVEGSGITAAAGGALQSRRALTIAADVESNADMQLTAASDGALAGNDLRIEAGAVVRLDSGSAATLELDAGDSIELDGGRIETTGNGAHRVALRADLENGGSDGVIGRVAQTGAETSVSAAHLSVGSGAGTALQTRAAHLTVDNSTAGDVNIGNAGDVELVGTLRNRAAGGVLALINDDGTLDTGTAEVSGNAGGVTLETRESNEAGVADIVVGAGGLHSAGTDIALRSADAIRLTGDVDAGTGELFLSAGSAIEQLAGRIASAGVRSDSGGETKLTGLDNAFDRYAASAGGDVDVNNTLALAVGASNVVGDFRVDNARALSVADNLEIGGRATLTSAAGNIDGAGARITAAELVIDSAGGIGNATALETDIAGDVFLRSRGTGSDGDIRIEEQGDFATLQLQELATDTASAQTVSLSATDVLTIDKDPVESPKLGPGDRLVLDATRIDLAEKISGNGVDVVFKAPVDVVDSAFISLNEGLITFEENVSPGTDTTLTLKSEVIFASGHVTGLPDSALVIEDTLNLATDTTIEVDNLRLSGDPASLTGDGSLTLLPATNGRDIVLGGNDGLAPSITLATLQGFDRDLNIGAPALPTTNSPFAGNVRVEEALSVGDVVLTVGGLGDVTLDNHDNPLESGDSINIIAVGDRTVFPNLVNHNGGDILDTDSSAGAPATLEAPVVNLIAQGRVGSSDNALEVEVGPGGSANFVTGASNAFINTIPAAESVNNIVNTSEVLVAYRAQGFFLEPLNQAALARTVGLETTGLETTGLGEFVYVDEGVFLLPDPYTTPVQATLLPALTDPGFPANLRPDDADDEAAWQSFYSGVLRQYVQSRYLIADDASASERAAVEARIESEWQGLVDYFQAIRARELAAAAPAGTAIGSGG